MNKGLKKGLLSTILAVLLVSTFALSVFAQSYSFTFNFDSTLYGAQRYFDNGKNFVISTNSTCSVNTTITVNLQYYRTYDNCWYTAATFTVPANGSALKNITPPSVWGGGIYRMVLSKPSSTYGKYAVGSGTISD